MRNMCLAIVVMAAPGSAALAATVNFVGPFDLRGTGFGNTLNVLSLQATPSEQGAVIWNGTMDVRSGDATNQAQTRTVTEFLAAGGSPSNFGVVFNIAEPGVAGDVTLNQFQLVFFNPAGMELFTGTYSTPRTLTQIDNGVGGAGYLFDVDLTAQELSFFSNPLNRIGMRVTTPIQDTAGAPDNFYLVPSPGATALLAVGGLLAVRRRK